MLAATDGVLPGLTWLYFALCQFPIAATAQADRSKAERPNTPATRRRTNLTRADA
jgi:hypothetical protein